jgi:multiple sugar transport system permease protein
MSRVITHIVLLAVCLVTVAPFIWSIFASLKSFKELVNSTDLLPYVWTLSNYQEIVGRSNFVSGFINSLLVAGPVTGATLLTSSAVGFVFAKYQFWGKEKLFYLILATLMVPFSVVLVPLYVTIVKLGFANQLSGLVVTGLWSTFGIFMLRQFMESIPFELLDASRIDGASEWRIFGQIVLPLSKAPLAALATFTFLGNWDSLLWPLVVLSSPDKQTLPLVLAGLRNLYWSRYDLWAAGAMLTVIPVMIVYSLGSRYFIQGIAMSGMKL